MSNIQSYNGISVRILPDYGAMSRFAADVIIEKVKNSPRLSLLVPTGTTPEGVYRLLAESSVNFQSVKMFNLDEYCVSRQEVIDPQDLRSYQAYMKSKLFDLMGDRCPESFFPGIENAAQEGLYDAFIRQNGGIDLCLNSMGEDGHTFGFNMPGSPFSSRTRLVRINQETRNVNRTLTGFETPEYAITVGLQTGMESREILFLVSGKRKSAILREVVYGPITEKVPATILRRHSNCTWILDEEAASLLGE